MVEAVTCASHSNLFVRLRLRVIKQVVKRVAKLDETSVNSGKPREIAHPILVVVSRVRIDR